MKIYAIIVTYNGRQIPYWYDKCFTSLRDSETPVHTIVVDNCSTDDTVSYIKTNFPDIHLIRCDRNLGFGQANNLGMRYALEHDANYVFLLNQDAWIEKDTITKLVRVAESHSEYGILCPLQLNKAKNEVIGMSFLCYPEHRNDAMFSDYFLGHVKEVYPIKEMNAAAWLLPRHTLEAIGGFDPLFFHYAEDDNYMSRVLYHKLQIGLVTSASFCHDSKEEYHKMMGDEQNPSFQKWLLQRVADIRYSDTLLQEYKKRYLLSAWKNILFLSFKKAALNFNYWHLLRCNENKIRYSRSCNKQIGRQWL